jgi:hypothetical protein
MVEDSIKGAEAPSARLSTNRNRLGKRMIPCANARLPIAGNNSFTAT